MEHLYRFQTLDIYGEALQYLDTLSELSERLPAKRAGSLGTRLLDSATHLVVQIAGRSSGESEIERSFMVDGTLLSLYETVACLDIIRRRKLLPAAKLEGALQQGRDLYDSLQKVKKSLKRR